MRNIKGFALVETIVVILMVVVLVVVTGSQLLAYNLQGGNAAAAADLRNAAAAEKMFFANWGVYASSGYFGTPGSSSVVLSSSPPINIYQGSINGSAPGTNTTFTISVSQNVGVVINTSAMGGSYTMGSKNVTGDRCFAMDSDFREVYWINGPVGQPMMSAGIPVANAGTGYSDIDNIGGTFPCLGVAPASVKWTAL